MNNNKYFYTINGEKVIFDNYKEYTKGNCGYLYKKDNTILKIYTTSCKYNYYVTKKMFNLLKELNIPNIVTLYDYYYYNNAPLFNHIIPPDAYTMKYIRDDNIDITKVSRDYLLETVNALEKTCIELSKNKILIGDAHHGNIIFNSNGVTLVDIDSYFTNNILTFKRIQLHNKKKILYFFRSKIEHDYPTGKENMICYKINNIISNLYKNDSSLTYEFSKILTKNNLTDSI